MIKSIMHGMCHILLQCSIKRLSLHLMYVLKLLQLGYITIHCWGHTEWTEKCSEAVITFETMSGAGPGKVRLAIIPAINCSHVSCSPIDASRCFANEIWRCKFHGWPNDCWPKLHPWNFVRTYMVCMLSTKLTYYRFYCMYVQCNDYYVLLHAPYSPVQ